MFRRSLSHRRRRSSLPPKANWTRLAVEPLEARRLLSTISGMRWSDLNGNGVQDDGEPPSVGWTVFLDDDRNGELDDGENFEVTDSDGKYAFTELSDGAYTVTEAEDDEWEQTFPSTPLKREPGDLLWTLANPTPAFDDKFGVAVGGFGDKVAVGAIGDDIGHINAGSVHLFDASSGKLTATLGNPSPDSNDHFGAALAVTDKYVLVGAPGDSTNRNWSSMGVVSLGRDFSGVSRGGLVFSFGT